jgi:SAM-dependent methyltransferase
MPEPDYVTAARMVYDYSARLYVDEVGTQVSARFEAPLDRAVLEAFVELVATRGPGPVLDIGCGPGRVAAYLADRGLAVRGVDISLRMVEAARAAHPALRFDVGPLTELPVSAASLLGAVYWYSIIATPLPELRNVWRELDRALAADGHVLVAFQGGENDRVERPDAYGSSIDLTLYRHSADDVVESLGAAGFDVRADIRRKAELPHEAGPQVFLLVERGRS